jgi:hypothetical protein
VSDIDRAGAVETVGPVDAAVVIDQAAGRIMRAIAVGGVVVSVVLSLVAWQFLGDLERNVDQSLRIGEEAADTLSETIDLAAEVIAAVDSGIVTLDRSLDALGHGLGDATDVAASTSQLSVDVANGVDDVDVALAELETLTGTIDSTLRSLSQLPLAPDYDPAVSYPDAIAAIRAAFVPIEADMRELATGLDAFAASSGGVTGDLDALQVDLADARNALADSDRLLDRYRTAATEAGALAGASRDDFERSMWWARFTALVLGVWLIAAQYVPWWLSRQARVVMAVAPPDGSTADQQTART